MGILNNLPTIITEPNIYIMRNGKKARIDTIKVSDNKDVTVFYCHGARETKTGKFKGYHGWHVSGRASVFESEFDIVEKI